MVLVVPVVMVVQVVQVVLAVLVLLKYLNLEVVLIKGKQQQKVAQEAKVAEEAKVAKVAKVVLALQAFPTRLLLLVRQGCLHPLLQDMVLHRLTMWQQ